MMSVRSKKLRGSFRWSGWDPRLLLAQIAALQALLFTSLALLSALAQDLTGAARTLDHIFAYHELHVRDNEGRAVIVAYLVNALIGAVALWMVVGRTKLCLDFTCTYHGLHVLACWWYNGAFPVAVGWWALQGACAAIMCVSAEFLCLHSELQAIPLTNIGGKVDL